MKSLILGVVLFAVSVNTLDIPVIQEQRSNKLVSHISSKYKISINRITKIVGTVNRLVDEEFPKKADVLAIIAIESEFKNKAISNKGAKGLMQVLYKKTTSDIDNISAGVDLLREYRRRLGSEKAAIHAYNIGIGNYLKGIRAQSYYTKYALAKSQLIKHIA